MVQLIDCSVRLKVGRGCRERQVNMIGVLTRRQVELARRRLGSYVQKGTIVSRVSEPSSGFPQPGNNPISAQFRILTTVLLTRLRD